jgi:hypothetical protein
LSLLAELEEQAARGGELKDLEFLPVKDKKIAFMIFADRGDGAERKFLAADFERLPEADLDLPFRRNESDRKSKE